MIRYTPQNQLTLEGFDHPFDQKLDPENRWVNLAEALPWDELANIYIQSLCEDDGRPTIDVRLAIGALIIKHLLKLSDREVVDTIQENIYIQYFVGFSAFRRDPAFDPSLFVTLRKRMGQERFDEMTQQIIRVAEAHKKPRRKKKDPPPPQGPAVSEGDASTETRHPEPPRQGTLKLDATVADQMIQYPTDLGLLNRCREESERLIDGLYAQSDLKTKPRTYRVLARKAFLAVAKKRQKPKKLIRKAIGQQLRYLNRNLRTIDYLLDALEGRPFPLTFRDLRIYWVIQHIYRQQKYMYDQRIHRCSDRIVNIYQPYVRPIIRGKDRANVEFGAKLGVSEVDGFCRVNQLSWDAYNESADLSEQVEAYRQLYGHYPELVLADQIYLTRANRAYLKERGIRHRGHPLGRPAGETPYERRKRRKEQGMRNHIEGKFGQGKNGYNLDEIRARRQDTSESWIAGIFFSMNLVTLMKVLPVIAMVLWTMLAAFSEIFFSRQKSRNRWNTGGYMVFQIP